MVQTQFITRFAVVAGIIATGAAVAPTAGAATSDRLAVTAVASPQWFAHRSLPVGIVVQDASPLGHCRDVSITTKWRLAPGNKVHSQVMSRPARKGTWAGTAKIPARFLHAGNVLRYAVLVRQYCVFPDTYLWGRSPQHGWHKIAVNGLTPSDE
jgi:hypothetical protein